MQVVRKLFVPAVAVAGLVLVSGCGGGGSHADSATTSPVKTAPAPAGKQSPTATTPTDAATSDTPDTSAPSSGSAAPGQIPSGIVACHLADPAVMAKVVGLTDPGAMNVHEHENVPQSHTSHCLWFNDAGLPVRSAVLDLVCEPNDIGPQFDSIKSYRATLGNVRVGNLPEDAAVMTSNGLFGAVKVNHCSVMEGVMNPGHSAAKETTDLLTAVYQSLKAHKPVIG